MRKLLIFLIVAVGAVAVYLILNKPLQAPTNKQEQQFNEQNRQAEDTAGQIVGGQRDEHGCLGPAGYSYDSEIKACVRSWEMTEANFRRAAAVAVSEVKANDALTVTKVEPQLCLGCYLVTVETQNQERTEVSLTNWKIKSVIKAR